MIIRFEGCRLYSFLNEKSLDDVKCAYVSNYPVPSVVSSDIAAIASRCKTAILYNGAVKRALYRIDDISKIAPNVVLVANLYKFVPHLPLISAPACNLETVVKFASSIAVEKYARVRKFSHLYYTAQKLGFNIL